MKWPVGGRLVHSTVEVELCVAILFDWFEAMERQYLLVRLLDIGSEDISKRKLTLVVLR